MTPVEKIETLMLHQEAGWWEALCREIPALDALADTPQPPEYHAEGDVAIHTRLAIEACPNHCNPDLRWVALLHDIGKPATTQQNVQGRITAYGHDKLGARMAEEILNRLEMPEERRERILWAIRYHTFHHSWQLQTIDDLSKRQRRYLTDPNFPLLLEFLRIDSIASYNNPSGMETYNFYKELWESIP